MSSARPAFHMADRQPASDRDSVAEKDFKHSEITRCLCAAAYLDANFRHEVIKHCIDEKHKAIGPCFGMDLVTVARHCLIAESKLSKRDWLLFGLTALVFVSGVGGPVLATVVFFLAWALGFAVYLRQEFRIRSIVLENFHHGKFDPDAGQDAGHNDLSPLAEQQSGNAVIYSGFTPFVGSGIDLSGWSFALDVDKGCQEMDTRRTPKAFEVAEIYEHVQQDIEQLNLKRVTTEDRVYVNGQDIREDGRFLDNPLARPKVKVDPQIVKGAMEQSSQQARHYRCIRVIDWSGELVLSIFLRFSKLSHNLFVEANYFLLTPLYEQYRKVDAMPPHLSLGGLLKMLTKAAIVSALYLLFSPFLMLARLQMKLMRSSERRQEEKNILENPAFDYGAGFSIRQWTSSGAYRRYFQKLDREMYLKILEKNVLDSIVTFLEERDVDVSELKQRQTTILNNGVMMSGGSINADSVAVGQKATSMANKVTQAAGQAFSTATGKS